MPSPRCRSLVALAALLSLGAPPAGAAPLAPRSAPAEPKLEERIAPMVARPGGLTSEEVARRAARSSPEVAGRRAEAEAAEAALRQAKLGFVPRVALSLGYTRLSEITPPLLGYAVVAPDVVGPVPAGHALVSVPLSFAALLNSTAAQATLSLPLSDYLLRLSRAYTAARGSSRAAAQQALAQELRVRADAKLTYYGWTRAALSVMVAEQALAQSRGHLRDVRASFVQGVASRADVLRVESQVAAAEGLLERARNLRLVLEEQLRTLMHEPPGGALASARICAGRCRAAGSPSRRRSSPRRSAPGPSSAPSRTASSRSGSRRRASAPGSGRGSTRWAR